VANATDLNGTLDVAGQTDLAAAGVATNVRGTLDVAEQTDLAATGESTNVRGTLNVAELATFTGNVDVSTHDGATVGLQLGGTLVTATAPELNTMDGITSTTTELNILDGVTADATELNTMDGITSTTAELNILDGVTADATEINLLDGVTATTTELNYVDVATPGTAEATKALVTDTNQDIDLGTGDLTATNITATTLTDGAASISGGNITTSGSILSSGSTGIGYETGAGAGGTVTQSTSKSTAVNIDKISGQITTSNSTLNYQNTVEFTVNNSTVSATDVIIINIAGGTDYYYEMYVSEIGSGYFKIKLINYSTIDLSESIDINFAVIKATQN